MPLLRSAFSAAALLALAAFPAHSADNDLRVALRGTQLDVPGAGRVAALRLDVGGAILVIDEGWIVPATEIAGQVREFVFLGSARFEMEPHDAVEANQLELFTGARTVARGIEEAVLVVGSDAAAGALLRGTREPLDDATSERARGVFSTWLASGERATLQVEQWLWLDALGEATANSYFAGWFLDAEDERFLYNFDPWEFEQISLGQFVPRELTGRQERRMEKLIGKEQRKGRLIGLDVAELGIWDSWISSSPLGEDGIPRAGSVGFDAEHYQLAIDIAPKSLELTGEANLVLRATVGGTRAVPLALASDLVVESVTDAAGRALDFDQDNSRVIIVWPEAPAAGDSTAARIRYRGRVIEEWDGARILRSTISWYPSLGFGDRATFDATVKWPRKLELVGSGMPVDSGDDGSQRWVRRRLSVPSAVFSFELGRFDMHTTQAGDVPITLALDPGTRQEVRKDIDTILETARQALLYYEELFGEYPFEDLTIATVPRFFSQATPGFITLARWSAFAEADDDEDETSNRWTLAHEIAHQWWGHAVGWRSYRDQWISEAMANYAALLYVRNQLEGKRRGPTVGWRSSLLRTTLDGHTIESLGPLVMGPRLVSSQSSSAYYPIVYRKGAVVIDMLARSFGEETFVKILRSMIRAVRGREISTEDFFELIERITDANLSAFTEQFIYGTGLPEVYYDYTIEKTEDDQWLVRGEATQSSPYRLEYSLVERRDGLLDVERRQVVQIDVERSALVVPVQAVLYDPDKESSLDDPEATGNTVMQFHALIRGRTTPFEFRTPHEPKQVWLDARSEVFGHFFSQRRSPKRVLYQQGADRADAKQWDAATDKFEEALEAPPLQGRAWDREEDSEEARQRESAAIDARVHWLLVQMHLDRGRTQSAQAAFDAAEAAWRGIDKSRPSYSKTRKPAFATLLEARLNLQKRNPQRAYEVLRDREIDSREWYLSMALATRALGRTKEFEAAREEAERRGADVSLLDEPAAP